MSSRNVVMVIIIVGALVVAGVLVAKQLAAKDSSGETFEQLVHYSCRDCKKDFSITLAELVEHKGVKGQAPFPCTHCSSIATSKGEPCWSCDRIIITGDHGAMPSKCPHCGSEMTDSPTTGTP